ncbi:hypothetical protein ABZ372_40690, partial [Streptomyces sp. NPDC005921]
MNPRYAYRALLTCDIVGSAGRGQQRQQEIRRVLRTALSDALDVAGLDARDFTYVDTGDGFQLVAPSALPKAGLLVPLLPELSARIPLPTRPSERRREHGDVHCAMLQCVPPNPS